MDLVNDFLNATSGIALRILAKFIRLALVLVCFTDTSSAIEVMFEGIVYSPIRW